MNIYHWKNQNQSGLLQATSIHHAKALLMSNHIEWQSVRKHYRFSLFRQTINKNEINWFLQQLSHLITANFTIIESIQIIIASTVNWYFEFILLDIEKMIIEGNLFHEALKKHPLYFSNLTCSLIQLGEVSGNLNQVLQHITLEYQKNLIFINKIKKAAFYPCVVIFIALIITTGLLVFVVPQFADFYQAFSGSLPIMTQILIAISDNIQKNGEFYFFSMLLIACIILFVIKKNNRVSNLIAIASLKIPILGNIIQKIILLRCLRSLNLLIYSGMTILNALELVKNICQHPTYEVIFAKLIEKTQQGYSLADSLTNEKYIPALMITLIKTGEASGCLNNMLNKAIFFYEQSLDQQLNQLQLLIEPILLIILSILVIFILLAMYLPIFNMGNII